MKRLARTCNFNELLAEQDELGLDPPNEKKTLLKSNCSTVQFFAGFGTVAPQLLSAKQFDTKFYTSHSVATST